MQQQHQNEYSGHAHDGNPAKRADERVRFQKRGDQGQALQGSKVEKAQQDAEAKAGRHRQSDLFGQRPGEGPLTDFQIDGGPDD